MDRRSLLARLSRGLIGLVGAGLAALGGLFAASASRSRDPGKWVAACLDSELTEGLPRACLIRVQGREGWYRYEETRSIFVLRTGSEIRAISRRCSHLGCPVDWNAERQRFLCPCHGGEFGPRGEVLRGPPRVDLLELPSRRKGALVEVRVD